MGFGVLFVRQLTRDEIDTFRKVSKCAIDGRLAMRYQAIWFSHLGKSVQEIAELLDISEEPVRNWIHIFDEEGFEGLADDWRSGRPPKANEDYIERLLASPPRRTAILFEDETELHLNPRIQKTWQSVGEPMKVNSAGKDRKLNLFGTANPGTGTVVTRFCQHKRSDDFVSLLRQIARRYRGWHVKIVLDNYCMHFTKRVQNFLDGLGGRIELVPLLTYSPHLNPIEGFWLFLKSHVASNHLYEDLKELKRTVLRFLRHIESGRMEGYNFLVKNGKNLLVSP